MSTPGATRLRISDDKARLRDAFLADYWHTPAPCKQAPDMWHSESLAQRNIAERACKGLDHEPVRPCPLLAACDAWASAKPAERYGVWGGRDRNKKEKAK